MDESKNKYIMGGILVSIAALVLLASYLQWIIFDFGLLAVGIVGGLLMSYIMYQQFMAEHRVLLNEGEEIIHDASNCNSHLMIRNIGDDNPQSVVPADLYMTNIGIIAEDPLTRELLAYIPLDRIMAADLEGRAIKVDFFDESNEMMVQVVLQVGRDFDGWAQSMYQFLSERKQQIQNQSQE